MSPQDLLSLRSQMSGQVNVGLEAAPQQDLTKVMEEIREYYEALVQKNSKELDSWFSEKVGHAPGPVTPAEPPHDSSSLLLSRRL